MSDRSRLRATDLVSLASIGLRMRRLRAALSALGICIGIAAIVGVLGITQSSESDLLAQIDRLGTNLLTVQNGRSFNGDEGRLPLTASAMIGHMPAVQHVSATALLTANVYRSDLVPSFETGGIGVRAVDTALLDALDGAVLPPSTPCWPRPVPGSADRRSWSAGHPRRSDRLDQPTRVRGAFLNPASPAPPRDIASWASMAFRRGSTCERSPTRLRAAAGR